jgi:sarcosine oxidase/L-pipecolate oxidase
MCNPNSSYLIVGAGVFGASTALQLTKKYPSATVSLIDRSIPCQAGASWDCSKVVRADYPDILYMTKALEAMEAWRTDPLYSQFYHQSGLIWVDSKGFAQSVIENYNRLGADAKVRLADPEEVKKLYGGIFENAEYGDGAEILINESSGWVEAGEALENVIDAAVAAGLRCIEADIASLEFDDGGSCTGVKSVDGQNITAAKVILATGSQTCKLIADSAPDRADLQVGDRLVAAAIFTGMAKLSAEEAGRFRAGPIFLHAIGQSQGVFHLHARILNETNKIPKGASFPPNAENQLKFARDVSFTNTVEHSSGRLISMPPDEPYYAQWNLSQRMKDELDQVREGIFGKNSSKSFFENYRICW